MSHDGKILLSVIIPFLDEQESLPELRRRFESAQALPDERELIFVSDGSTDGGPAFIDSWAREDQRVRLIELTRNFGQQAAIRAGLEFARGERVAVMDADLQDTPEDLAQMYARLSEGGSDIVYAVRASREGNPLKRLAYWLFYRLYALLADAPYAADSGDFCVLSSRAADALRSFPERVQYIRGLRSWTGLSSEGIEFDRPERTAGRPSYTIGRLLSLAVNGIVSFSGKPLRVATLFGAILCAGSVLLAGGYVVKWAVYDIHSKAPGFTTLVVLLLFLSGAQMMLIGVLGEYLRQIFLEVKRRPVFLVSRTVNLDPPMPEERSGRGS